MNDMLMIDNSKTEDAISVAEVVEKEGIWSFP